jgi:hypothetical protein
VIGAILADDEILGAIVVTDPVDVMDFGTAWQQSFEHALCHHNVLGDVADLVRLWVAGVTHVGVAIWANRPTAIPSGMALAAGVVAVNEPDGLPLHVAQV